MPNFLTTSPSRDQAIAYNIFRAFVGLDFFGHGYARIFTGTYLQGFAEGMQTSMATAPLAPSLVLVAGYVIPVLELIVGILLLLGIFTRAVLYAAFGLMFVLMFGVTMKQDWNAAGQQLLYGLVLFVLLALYEPFRGGWMSVLRWKDTPGPVGVPARVHPIAPDDSIGPLGRT